MSQVELNRMEDVVTLRGLSSNTQVLSRGNKSNQALILQPVEPVKVKQ